jgi:hypothetical protein
MAEIVLVHVGTSPLPKHLEHLLQIARRVAPRSSITLLTQESHIEESPDLGAYAKLVAVEQIPCSSEHRAFASASALNRSFRDGFWYHTTSRFLVLTDYMRFLGLEDVVHFENDVVPYFDPDLKLDAFRGFADFAVPLDRKRAIASVVWLANSTVAEKLSTHLANIPAASDMDALHVFCQMNESIAKPLPTLPEAYARSKGLSEQRYCQGIDRFGGIFDAAAIGQFLGGVDRMNNPHDSRGFVNESSDLDMRDFGVSWAIQEGVRHPLLTFSGEGTQVLCAHVHSKDVNGFSPFTHGAPTSEADLLTGERLQGLADTTLSTAAITKFHGAENIRTSQRLEIPANALGQLLVPDPELLVSCSGAKVIFVYPNLLEYFRLYVAPRLQTPFVLISHNADHSVGLESLPLLNHPYLIHWWAQNCEIAHERLSALPTGLANIQSGALHLSQLFGLSRHIRKDKLLYAKLELTHPSRAKALEAVAKVAGATTESGPDYIEYLAALARHKFCLCPQSSGIDTHRFWEAQYLDCIPVILREDWTSAYSELPLLVLQSWDDFPSIDLDREYLRISTTHYRRNRLSLDHFRNAIAESFDRTGG